MHFKYSWIITICLLIGPIIWAESWAENTSNQTLKKTYSDQAILRIKTEVYFKSDMLVFDGQVKEFYCLLGSSALEAFLVRLFSAPWKDLEQQQKWEALTAIRRLQSFVAQQRVVLAKGLEKTFTESLEKTKCFKNKGNAKFKKLFELMTSEVYLRSRFKYLLQAQPRGDERLQQQQNLRLFYQTLQKEIPVVWLTR